VWLVAPPAAHVRRIARDNALELLGVTLG
jgi:hypothetical protein